MLARPLSTNSRETLTQAGLRADEPLEPDLGERVEHDRRGRALGVGDQRGGRVPAPEQQLVTGDLEVRLKIGCRATNTSDMGSVGAGGPLYA